MTGYQTDKSVKYLKVYEEYFAPFKDKEITLFELGVFKGGSLLLWRDYFQNGHIVGLDANPVDIHDSTGRTHIYRGLQQDTALLDRISLEMAPHGFDVIVDDASHLADPTRIAFWHLFNNHLKPGGIYAIEDWGTGYWQSWPDGRFFDPKIPKTDNSIVERIWRLEGGKRSLRKLYTLFCYVAKPYSPNHSYGMVGFVKQLVDECGMGDITKPGRGISPYRPSKFRKMQISPEVVIVVKTDSPP